MLSVAIATLAISVIVGFARVMRMLSRMEMRLELVWEWYLEHHADRLVGGRRRSDPKEI